MEPEATIAITLPLRGKRKKLTEQRRALKKFLVFSKKITAIHKVKITQSCAYDFSQATQSFDAHACVQSVHCVLLPTNAQFSNMF